MINAHGNSFIWRQKQGFSLVLGQQHAGGKGQGDLKWEVWKIYKPGEGALVYLWCDLYRIQKLRNVWESVARTMGTSDISGKYWNMYILIYQENICLFTSIVKIDRCCRFGHCWCLSIIWYAYKNILYYCKTSQSLQYIKLYYCGIHTCIMYTCIC